MMPKSRSKEKFQFLKQILEDSSASDKENGGKKYTTEVSSKIDGSALTESVKKGKDSASPVGKYPVLFKKTCRNKSCQTKLSSFPLFPLPEETEWISDEEGEKKKKSTALKKKRKQGRSVSKEGSNDHVQQNSETDHKLSKVKNSDGTRKSFRSEHQLKESDNPILQAWLHKKAIVACKQRKLEQKEKRAKRAALEEEARIQAERAVESNEKVGDWLKKKRKEARMVWRKSRSRIAPHQEDSTSHAGGPSPQPPPEYTVVRSFKCTKSSAGHMTENGGENQSNSVSRAISMNNPSVTASNNSSDKVASEEKTGLNIEGDLNTSANSANHVKHRPKTAVDRTENTSSSRPKTAIKRPKTSKERSLKVPSTQGTTSANNNATKKMQSLSYDEWLRVKRDGDKEKMIQKKRDLIDTHLEAVIKELGKNRVEKIMSPRKHVDTGLKNFSRAPPPVQPDSSKVKKNNPYRWVLSKKPRPEPQGCDCPESHSTDGTTSASCHAKNNGDAKDGKSSEQPKVHICEEIDEKYNELKPSIEKVKDILDSEIKKLKESGKGLGTNVDKPSQLQTVDSKTAGDSSANEPKLLRPTSARPPSARPATARPSSARPGSAYLTKEQAKKIASDLDVLGLCDSDQEQEETNKETGVDVKHDAKSTVRENYFDYGSDVDAPTMESAQ